MANVMDQRCEKEIPDLASPLRTTSGLIQLVPGPLCFLAESPAEDLGRLRAAGGLWERATTYTDGVYNKQGP